MLIFYILLIISIFYLIFKMRMLSKKEIIK
jgi:hypothetical protein